MFKLIAVDIGCGSNKNADYIGIDCLKVTSVDIVMDASHLAIKDNCVDTVFSRRCLQHVADLDLSNVQLLCEQCNKKKTAKDAAAIAKRRATLRKLHKDDTLLLVYQEGKSE